MAQPPPTSGRAARREPLSLPRISRAALELLDESGPSAVTMRAIGQRLGVEAMSLYRYVDSRDRLLDAVIDLVVDELADDPDVELTRSGPWRDWLAAMARGVRRYSRAHPLAFPLIATHPTQGSWMNPPLRSPRWVDALLRGLTDDGFGDDTALFAYRLFNTFLLGYLLLETSALRAQADGDGMTAPGTGVDADEFPTLARLAPGLAEARWDEEFEAGLAAMLDRIAREHEG